MPNLVIFNPFKLLSCKVTMPQITHFYSVKLFAWNSGSVNLWQISSLVADGWIELDRVWLTENVSKNSLNMLLGREGRKMSEIALQDICTKISSQKGTWERVCNECNYNELKIIWRLHLLRFWYFFELFLLVGCPLNENTAAESDRWLFFIFPKKCS